MKRIVLLTTALTLVATMMVTSALSVSAQNYSGQYSSNDQYAPTTGQTNVCAPWSKAWDVSNGKWWYQWYRWCYDPSTSDPSYEGSWYQELGSWEWGEPVNLCPESGKCTVSTGPGSMQMSSDTTSSPVTDTQTATDSTPPVTDAQTPTTTP